jgi:hypothetical protein
MMETNRYSRFICMVNDHKDSKTFGADLRIMPDGRFILVSSEVEVAKALGREYYDCDPRKLAVVEIGAREAFAMMARECDEETLARCAQVLTDL